MRITSPAFDEGEPIPTRHTCEGENVSPVLKWTDVPPETESLALIVDDPDAPAGTWVHWVLYGLPPDRKGLSEHVPAAEEGPDGSRQGRNDFRRIGYGGPCPPPNGAHRYFFKLYALDDDPDLEAGATKDELLAAMDGHVLAEARLIGTYRRSADPV